MRIKLTILVVLYFSLLTTAGSAQTAAEQMQRAIYTQETTGDLDSAVQMYRQILAAAPPRPLGAQAQFRLAQALLQKGDLQDAALESHSLSQNYPEYKGMIASMASQLRVGIPLGELGTLENGGYRAEEFERVYAPMGLEIGALAPEEIAISIVAELIAIRRNAESAAHKKLNYEPRPALTER